MKYTLLELVQSILASLESDEVNSITDTSEASDIAKLVRDVYVDMLVRANLPEHYSMSQMTASLDAAKPTVMYIPDTVEEVLWLKYNKATATDTDLSMKPVVFKPKNEFITDMYSLRVSDSNVGSFTLTTDNGFMNVLYLDDKAPSYYTTFDDRTLLFDSYDAGVDTTLQSSKTLAYTKNVIPFTFTDNFVPDLDASQFSLLLNECKSLAWAEKKQTSHTKAEVGARRGWVSLQRKKDRTEHPSPFDKLPNYGR